jgi:TRAP-type uncharacterized transport system fused permease subunit
MQGSWGGIVWHLARNILGIFVGTAAIIGYTFLPLSVLARLCYGAAAVAILVPPDMFPGADVVDWVGLGVASAALIFDHLRSRGRLPAFAPQPVKPG